MSGSISIVTSVVDQVHHRLDVVADQLSTTGPLATSIGTERFRGASSIEGAVGDLAVRAEDVVRVLSEDVADLVAALDAIRIRFEQQDAQLALTAGGVHNSAPVPTRGQR